MPNTSRQLDNIIKKLSKVVGGSTRMAYSYASIPVKVDYANKQANRLDYYVAANTGGGSAGTVFNAPSFEDTSSFTPVGNLTPTIDNGAIELTASNSGVYTNRLNLTSILTDLPQWTISATFRITVGAGLFGIGIGTSSANTGDKFEIVGRIELEDSSADIIIDTGINGSFSSAFTGNPITVASNNIITLKLVRDNEIFDMYAYNQTTGVNNAARYTYTPAGGPILPNISRFSVYLFGGTNYLLDLDITSSFPTGLSSIFVGDSKIAGYYGAMFPLNIAGQLSAAGYSTSQLAGGSEMTADVLNRIQEIIDLRPNTVALAIGSNDIRASVPSGTWQANYASIVNQLTGAGINVVHILPMKETSINIDPLYNYINSTYSSNKIDAYTGFNTGTMLNGDGIHPNTAGMNFVVGQVISSGLIPI